MAVFGHTVKLRSPGAGRRSARRGSQIAARSTRGPVQAGLADLGGSPDCEPVFSHGKGRISCVEISANPLSSRTSAAALAKAHPARSFPAAFRKAHQARSSASATSPASTVATMMTRTWSCGRGGPRCLRAGRPRRFPARRAGARTRRGWFPTRASRRRGAR